MDVLCNERHDIRWNGCWGKVGIPSEDGETGLDVGTLDVGQKAPFETASQSILEC